MTEAKRKSAPSKTLTTIEEILAAKKAHRVTRVVDIDGREVKFVFEAMGGAAYDALVGEHRINPSPGVGFNLETAALPLIEACLVEPSLSSEALGVLWESTAWSSQERIDLLQAALEVNGTSSVRVQGKR